MKILSAQINPTVGDLEGNLKKVVDGLDRGRKKGADVILFPELTLTGYFPDDLLLESSFIDAVEEKLEVIAPLTKGIFAVIGLPRRNPSGKEKPLYNSAAIFIDGKLQGFKDKTLLPTYDVFDERRYFEPGTNEPIWEYLGHRIAVTICEDVWQHSGKLEYTSYQTDPVEELQKKRPDLVLNLSGSPYSFRRKEVRLAVFQAVAQTLHCPLILCNQVGGNDQLIFDGYSFFLDEKGELIQLAKGFVEDDLLIDLNTHACHSYRPDDGIQDLYSALCLGVRDYFHKQGFQKGLLGLSGGIDSALVLCIAKDALGPENVLALSLPSRFTSAQSQSDAELLAKNLSVELKTIPMDSMFQNYLNLLHQPLGTMPMNETAENLQARIRGMILMAFSNALGMILLNTGNKSEMAMGYTTLYGDMAGGLGVLLDVTKLRIYALAAYVNREDEIIPRSIIERTPTAELRENQTDFDTLPRFELLDPLIEDYLEELLSPQEISAKRNLPLEEVLRLTKKMDLAEYKRRQAPIGIRVTERAFGKGRVVPIVQKWNSLLA